MPGNHSLLKEAKIGVSTYSDLGYRLIAELLEAELGLSWKQLGAAASGLGPAPWNETPMSLPPGQDSAAWALAEPGLAYPESDPHRPHDANARVGMIGHSGFGASRKQLEISLEKWMLARWPDRMAVETARSEDGEIRGLGLERATAPYTDLLARIPLGATGTHMVESLSNSLPEAIPAAEMPAATAFWQQLAYPGSAIFVRLEDRCCVALLCHRAGPGGELLSLAQLRQRRRRMLMDFLAKLGA